MKNVVIAGYCRSPFTPAYKGLLSTVRPDDLVAQVVKGLINKTGVKPCFRCCYWCECLSGACHRSC